jgi:hypothetical protein
MKGFSAEWLATREPYDQRARNPAVLDSVIAWSRNLSSITIVDLGCGTGAMLRVIAPRLGAHQNWRLIDYDSGLLSQIDTAFYSGTVQPIVLDLNRDLETALEGTIDLVINSALLDLVSETWFGRFATLIAARMIPIYATLNFTGIGELVPIDPFDGRIIAAVSVHQETDKGFGPALGQSSAPSAIARLKTLGYSVDHGTSDWSLGSKDHHMQLTILSDWAAAACAVGVPSREVTDWLIRRNEQVLAGRSSMRINHIDFFACQIGIRVADRSKSNKISSPSR